MSKTDPRAGFAAGTLATIALLGLMFLLGPFANLSFAPWDLADIAIRLAPGVVATEGIEALGSGAKLLAKLCALLALVLLGGALGTLKSWADGRRMAAPIVTANAAAFVLFVVLFGLGLLNAGATQSSPLLPFAFLALMLSALAWGAGLSFLAAGLSPRMPIEAAGDQAKVVPEPDRRAFLLRSGAAVVTIAAGSAALAELSGATAVGAPEAMAWPQPISLTTEAAFDAPGFVAPAGLRPRVTTQDELYYISSRLRDPRVAASSFTLSITGNVDNPLTLSLDQILRLPRVEQTSTLQCISNQVGGDLIGNPRWVGTPLAGVLQRAGIRPQTQRLVLYGADGYNDSIALEDALKPSTLLAYGIDGEALTRPHGFPLRLIVPNIYGMKNVKWIERIDVVTFDYQGYWQERGWDQAAITKTSSVVDTGGRVRSEGTVPLGGIAVAGSRGISKVEVRVDDSPWQEATLEPEPSPLQWRRWRYDWPAAPGTHTISVRAVDGDGQPQTDRVAEPHPDGASGYHSVRVSVG